MTGRLLGIARRSFPKAPMTTMDRARIGLATGVAGDFRGAMKPGRRNRRQVTLMQADDWAAALAGIGAAVPWEQRRCNLLVTGVALPRQRGAIVRIGADVLLEINGECDPCRRMDGVAPGLMAALTPDWRGGRIATVVAEGEIVIGDAVIVEREMQEWATSRLSTT